MFERYKARKEIEKRLEGVEGVGKRRSYLTRILSKKTMLSPVTREVVHQKLADTYLEDFQLYKEQIGNGYMLGSENTPVNNHTIGGMIRHAYEDLSRAIENYAQGGDISRARKLLREGTEIPFFKSGELGGRRHKYISSGRNLTGVSLGFNADSLEFLINKERRKRERGVPRIATSILSLIGGLYFFSANVTGNVIGNLTTSISNVVGGGLIVVGLVAGFFWVRGKKK